MSNIYIENGFKDRRDYFRHLADEHGISIQAVYILSDILGTEEDFDGLVSACADAENMFGSN